MTESEPLSQSQEKLFNDNVEYARILASKYPQIFDDAYSFALEALTVAVRNWDPTRSSIKTYTSRIFDNLMKDFFSKQKKQVPTVSLDQPMYEEEGDIIELQDVLEDLKSTKLGEEVLYNQIKDKLRMILDDKQYRALELLEEKGLGYTEEGRHKTLDDIRKEVGYASSQPIRRMVRNITSLVKDLIEGKK
jgi:DNA-directed RNA polymerase specialized sigma24 family protein